VEELTEAALRRRIRAATEPGEAGALAFDGDGTLWTGDVGDDFFEALLDAGDLRPEAVEAMRGVASLSGLGPADPGAGVAVARQLWRGYLDGRVAEEAMFETITWACAGWREDEIAELAGRVIARAGMESRRRPELAALIAWAREEGLEPFVVSASPRAIVEAAAAPLGFDRAHVVAATARFSPGGVMLTEVVRPIPYAAGKATLLAAALAGRPLVAAFGDNVFDVPMLEAARVAVIVEPKPRLVAHLAAHAGAPTTFSAPPVRLLVG
jgi:phosphoserine phosphatase